MQRRLSLAFALCVILAPPVCELSAQAWAYPSFQPPRITYREFNVGLGDARHVGTSIVFQWREQVGPRHQFSMDLGLADPDGRNSNTVVFVGGQFAWEVTRSTSLVPFDFLFTAGGNLATGNGTVVRIPVGVVVGHRFPTEGEGAVTPYVHPRLTLDLCSRCKDNLNVVFDIGANVELTRAVAVRAVAMFSGTNAFNGDGFGLSLAWSPPGLAGLQSFLRP